MLEMVLHKTKSSTEAGDACKASLILFLNHKHSIFSFTFNFRIMFYWLLSLYRLNWLWTYLSAFHLPPAPRQAKGRFTADTSSNLAHLSHWVLRPKPHNNKEVAFAPTVSSALFPLEPIAAMLKTQTLEFRIKSYIFLSSSLTEILVSYSRSIMFDSLQPTGYSLPGSSVHGILQSRILDWVAIPFPRGSFPPRYQTQVSCIADGLFTIWVTRETQQRSFFFFPEVLILSKCTCIGSGGKSLPRVPYTVTRFIRDTAGCLKDALVQTLTLPGKIHHAGSGRATAENWQWAGLGAPCHSAPHSQIKALLGVSSPFQITLNDSSQEQK